MSINILLQIPGLLLKIKKEHQLLNQIIQEYNIDAVISDNRFGLHTSLIPCVFITHQLEIQSSNFKKTIQNINYKYINKYSACWVIDDKKHNLAGKLSKPKFLPKNNIHYIGNQSRFKKNNEEKKYDFLAIVSGPEPQRTIFERGVIKALKNRSEKSIIVLGKPEKNKSEKTGNLTIKSHLNAKELNRVILQSDLIICRPGYSTIMDLSKLEKKAFFIPTPGQTEQEYLANNFFKQKICYMQKQSEFNFGKGVMESKNYSGFCNSNKSEKNWEELFSLF